MPWYAKAEKSHKTPMTKKIIILGGGIGGLTVAHELARSVGSKYEIHVYERNQIIGGMARSSYKERNGVRLPTEYCWRIYGPNYRNLRPILKQIPLKGDATKTVHDNLVDIRNYLIADQGTVLYLNNRPKALFDIRKAFKKIPFSQKFSVLSRIFYCFMISTKRLNQLDRFSWSEYINPKKMLGHDMRKYIIDIMGPYLGAENEKVNVPSVVKTLETFKLRNRPLSVMGGPTNEAWFDHWQAYLEGMGVTFHLGKTVQDVHLSGTHIDAVELTDGTRVTGDYFFCSLPIDIVAQLPSLQLDGMTQLAERGHQLMMGIQLYFDKKIALPYRDTALHIPDSPWQLVIEPQGVIWGKQYGDIADLWSVGLCDPLKPGLLIRKPFVECSHEEICKEVWYQICHSEFGNFLHLDRVNILDYNVWDTYVYDGTKIDTTEPKFSTNKGTYFLRPQNETKYENLFFATGYTQTKTDMFEMESAAESGRRAARLLDKTVRVAEARRPIFFAPYRAVDRLLSPLNMYRVIPFAWFALGLLPALVIYPFSYLVAFARRYATR